MLTQTWTKRADGGSATREAWDANSGDYRILVAKNGKFRLVSFIHEEDDNGNPWFRDFATLDEAQAYAEKI